MSGSHRQQTPIAVVGVSALCPGSADSRGFWSDILAGKDLVTDVPPTHWLIEDYYDPDPTALDKTYSKRGAFLSPVAFEPMEFGVPPSIVPATDTSQLLALIVAQRVLEDASQGQFSNMDRERISVLLGVTSGQELLGSMVSRLQKPVWLKALRESGIPETEAQAICEKIAQSYVPWQESSFPGLLGNVVAGRIANRFDLRGTNAVTDAACASSLAAVSMGINELQLGQSDLVITGGVDAMNDIFMYMCFSKTPALSPSGDCRPFSDAADGTLLGEGIAMVALKRLEDAERDGDRVYAVIRGVGSASDGRAKSVYAPLPEGQARSLRRAYEAAGYGPETVELVEAHGTGTKAGDAAEFEGLKLAFAESNREEKQWCALGSVKSQIGHTKAAAGAAGLFKAIMALHHKVLPPTIKIDRPNPKLDIGNSPFYLNTQRRPWIRDGKHPRRASVSSFGFGGSNFHITLEEFVPKQNARPAYRLRTTPTELLLLSADSATGLLAKCRALVANGGELSAVAREAQRTFKASDPVRLALIASSTAELAEKLNQAAATIEKAPNAGYSTPTGVHYAAGASNPGQLAFLFPGQGSQYVGMGAEVAMAFDAARAAWDAAASFTFDGEKLQDVVFPKPAFTDGEREAQAKKLTATEWAQPALGVQSQALANVLHRLGIRPSCVAGHSFGEVPALHEAGVLDAAGCIEVARKRGELMRDASVISGAMTAVSSPLAEVKAVLAECAADVVIANHNAPSQVVLSGSSEAIAKAEDALAAKGITAKRLSVATAFHSPLVAASSVPFLGHLNGVAVSSPKLDVHGTADAAPYPSDPEQIRARLAAQLALPVCFVDQIEAMYARGVRTFIEVGAGSVLTELVGRILGEREHQAINLDRKGRHGVTSLQDALGRLSVGGIAMELEVLWAEYAPVSDKPVKKAAMTLPISGTNYGRPYPPAEGAKALPAPNPPRVVEAPRAAPVPMTVAPEQRPAAVPAPMVAPPGTQVAWLQAFQEVQRQTSEAHAAYQRSMAESHLAFLNVAEASLTGLGQLISGTPAEHAMPAAPVAHVTPPALAYSAPLPPEPARLAPPPATVRAAPVDVPVAPRPPVATSVAPSVDLEALLLTVVAEKTGYPKEMLQSHMELEADLGIDSIKRVEILSAMSERAQGLREVKPTELAALRTLGQIAERMRAHAGAKAAAEPAAMASTIAPAAPTAPSVDLEALLLTVVAEKTGYPKEMLQSHMELEADLGIDSIKRVEILSAMSERAQGLREVKPTELAALRTLGQIAERMRAHAGATAAPSPVTAEGSTARAEPSVDLEALLLTVVAEKTGYPKEMLQSHMELEADLGIDSIKRVEILSAMSERAQGLREVKPTELAALRTLGQIAERMRAHTQGPAPVAPQVAAPAAAVDNAISRFVVREVPSPAIGMALAGLLAGHTVVVTDEGAGLASEVVKRLAVRGVRATVAATVPPDAGVVIFLGGMRSISSIEQAVAVNREAFEATRAVAARFGDKGGVLVTVQDTGGDFGLSGREGPRAWLGGISALARTAALEWPKARVKAIDCERSGRDNELIAEAIVNELFTGGTTLEVGLHADGRRTTLSSVKAPMTASSGKARIDSQSVVVASGGARGVTAAALIALAAAKRPRIVLLGRTALGEESAQLRGIADEAGLKRACLQAAQAEGRKPTPAELSAEVSRLLANREVRSTLAALEAAGSQVRYVAVDVQNAAALSTALNAVREEWGPITALVHGAGVLADKRIAEKTDEQFNRVFDTKVQGLRALLAATENDPLTSICLFSSIAARVGNPGQCDYAMANEVLNLVACAEQARRGSACGVHAIGWGAWDGGMVTPGLKAHFQQLGVALIPLDVGARMFVDELLGGGSDPVVVIGGAGEGGPLGASVTPHATLEVRVEQGTHGYLSDHRVATTPVVPVVLAVEWFQRAARACRPDLVCVAVKDVRVMRGIKLDGFERDGDPLVVSCKQVSNGAGARLSVELRGRNEGLHYTATVEMAERPAAPPAAPPSPPLERWTLPAVYDGGVLFHGPKFQVIRSVEGISRAGIVGTLVGTQASGWPAEPWRTDPAACDGGLQLALLWSNHVLGGAVLPMALGEYRGYRDGLIEGPLRCVLQGRKIHDARALCDISFSDASGAVVAELLGVETVLRPVEPKVVS